MRRSLGTWYKKGSPNTPKQFAYMKWELERQGNKWYLGGTLIALLFLENYRAGLQ